MNAKIEEMRLQIMKEMDDARYQHTLGVMYTAASMAMCHGEEVEKAMIAGILHDCAKCIPGGTKILLCEKFHIEIMDYERMNPGLLHAKLGAFIAEKNYHIADEDILMAIKSHTTGRPGMSLLEKIIYIADYMEPGRKHLPNMDEVRKLAFEDIDRCLYRILADSLTYLKSRNVAIDPMTEQTYYFYKAIMEGEHA